MSKYNKGVNFERRVRKDLENKGYYVVRSAGSKGVFDLIALKQHRRPLGVQCKYSSNPDGIEPTDFDTSFKQLHDFSKLLDVRTVLAFGQPRQPIIYWDGYTRERVVIV